MLIMSGFKDQMNKHELCLIMAFSEEKSLDWEDISCQKEDNLSHLQDDTYSKSL